MAGEIAAIESALEDIRTNYAVIASDIGGPRGPIVLEHLRTAIFKELTIIAQQIGGKDFYYQVSQLTGPSTVSTVASGNQELSNF